MAIDAAKRASLQAEARDALAQLGDARSVLIFDFSTGIDSVPETVGTQTAVGSELQKNGIDVFKLTKLFNRGTERVCYAIAGKAKAQNLSIADYVEEFAVQYREIGLPVFVN